MRDLLTLVAVLSGIILSVFILDMVWSSISGSIEENELYNQNVSNVLTGVSSSFQLVDYLIVLVLFSLMITIWYLTSQIPSSPILFWLSIIPIILIIYVSSIPSNILNEIFTNSLFQSQYNKYPSIVWIGRNFPLIVLITSFISSLILYNNSYGFSFLNRGGGYY